MQLDIGNTESRESNRVGIPYNLEMMPLLPPPLPPLTVALFWQVPLYSSEVANGLVRGALEEGGGTGARLHWD